MARTSNKSFEEITTADASAESFVTPAAILARERGEKTYVVNIAKRYDEDRERFLQIDDNPPATVPTEEDVEVAENEYYALKASGTLRKATNRMIEELVNRTDKCGAL